ncbi:hypothetical protein EON63_11080 [archaeon]|nr:MAG: hypothetical protein EON63_11080 [archaeon]
MECVWLGYASSETRSGGSTCCLFSGVSRWACNCACSWNGSKQRAKQRVKLLFKPIGRLLYIQRSQQWTK